MFHCEGSAFVFLVESEMYVCCQADRVRQTRKLIQGGHYKEAVSTILIHSFIANLFQKLSHIHNDIQYLEKENAEVVQLINAFTFNNYVINEKW